MAQRALGGGGAAPPAWSDELQVEDIVQFRAFAEVELQAEEALHRTAVEAAPKPQSTWFGWLTGASEQAAVPTVVDLGKKIELNSERETLAALLAGSWMTPRRPWPRLLRACAVPLKLSLDMVSLALLQPAGSGGMTPRTKAGDVEELAKLSLSGFHLSVSCRVGGFTAQGALHAMELLDCSAPEGSLGYAIIRPAAQTGGDVGGAATGAISAMAPQWQFSIIQNPVGRSEAFDVELRVSSPLEIVHKAKLMRDRVLRGRGGTSTQARAHRDGQRTAGARHLTKDTLAAIQASAPRSLRLGLMPASSYRRILTVRRARCSSRHGRHPTCVDAAAN